MLGPALMAAPFLERGGERLVYLPEGGWYDFWTGRFLPQSGWRPERMNLNRFPLFVRAGSVLPLGPVMQHAGERPVDPLELRLYSGPVGRFRYFDDDESFDIRWSGSEVEVHGGNARQVVVRIWGSAEPKSLTVNGHEHEFTWREGCLSFEHRSAAAGFHAEWRL